MLLAGVLLAGVRSLTLQYLCACIPRNVHCGRADVAPASASPLDPPPSPARAPLSPPAAAAGTQPRHSAELKPGRPPNGPGRYPTPASGRRRRQRPGCGAGRDGCINHCVDAQEEQNNPLPFCFVGIWGWGWGYKDIVHLLPPTVLFGPLASDKLTTQEFPHPCKSHQTLSGDEQPP